MGERRNSKFGNIVLFGLLVYGIWYFMSIGVISFDVSKINATPEVNITILETPPPVFVPVLKTPVVRRERPTPVSTSTRVWDEALSNSIFPEFPTLEPTKETQMATDPTRSRLRDGDN